MDLHVLSTVAIRVVVCYLFLFALVRVLGKRRLGAHSAFDFVVTILLANLAAEAIFGAVSIFHALFALALIGVLQHGRAVLTARQPRLARWLFGEPRVLIRNGEMLPAALHAERLSEAEIWSMLRREGVGDLGEVKLALLEPSGHMSVVRQDAAPVERGAA
jgi:uncharacterized membrane protein YcaP (DUF421 family)